MEIYAIRLSLILELLNYACEKSQQLQTVGLESVQGSIKLVEYFNEMALKVHSVIYDENPISKLPINKQKLYDALPNLFSTSEGLKIAESMDVSMRTFKYFISNRKLFSVIKRGYYEKLF